MSVVLGGFRLRDSEPERTRVCYITYSGATKRRGADELSGAAEQGQAGQDPGRADQTDQRLPSRNDGVHARY